VGVSEPERTGQGVNIFPVPFTNYLKISADPFETYHFTLYDPTSRLVGNFDFHGSTSLATNALATGPYFYQLRSDCGLVKCGMVLKQ
jgi:hypothetical protein